MGDGGVACMPLQQQHHMERFPIPEKTLYGNGGKNGSNSNNNGFNSKSLKLADTERKKKMKVKKEQFAKSGESEKSELGFNRGKKSSREVENGEIFAEKVQKEEVEEGELGTLNGEFVSRRSEIEKGEIVEKWRRSEVEKGEIAYGKWRKDEVEKGEIVPEKTRRGEAERVDFGSWRGAKDEIEKGEFIPDRWHKGEAPRDEYNHYKSRRYELGNDKGSRFELERTPPSGKYSGDDSFRRKEFNRNGSQLSKSTPRWESGQERNVRISSKIVDEEGLYRNEYSNGKNHGRDYSSGNRLKRYGTDSDGTERKYYGDYGDYVGSKSRRLSEDSNRTTHSDHYSRRSVERSYRNLASSKLTPSEKYSRHYESSLSSRIAYDRHGRSPGHSERSPLDRARYYDHRDRSPVRRERSPHGRERSPHGRNRHHDHRNRTPTHTERSPHDRARNHDRRDRTPNYQDRSPVDRSRPSSYREASRKGGTSEKRNPQIGSKEQEDKPSQRDPTEKDSHYSAKESQDTGSVHNVNGSLEKDVECETHKEEQSQGPSIACKESSHVDGTLPEELPSMEEDMDICDTPPHIPVVADSSTGKWFYLDYYGMECGPSKLGDLKALVGEGALMSDHLIKHLDSDRWVTVENATSPLMTVSFPFIASDTITQLVKPPEAPGNLLADTGDTRQFGPGEEILATCSEFLVCPDNSAATFEPSEDLHIDERVGALLHGFPVVPGKELETVAEALQMRIEPAEWGEGWGNSEGFAWYQTHRSKAFDQKNDQLSRISDIKSKEAAESRLIATSDKDHGFACGEFGDWFSGRWPCKGGDWKRNDEAGQDKSFRKKLVLNDGFSLCQMPKSGYEDPRWHRKDDLYYPSHSRRLDLPPWAFSLSDEKNDCSGVSRPVQSKSTAIVRGVKGTVLTVVRINACVVKDHGSFISDPRTKVRGKERYSSRSSRPYSSGSDGRRSSTECDSQSKSANDQGSQDSWKCVASINPPKDRLCSVDDLQLHLGDWYYLDGAGRELGPSSFSHLQVLADQGVIQKHISVFRKFDKIWVPVLSAGETTSEASVKSDQENTSASGDSSRPFSQSQGAALDDSKMKPSFSHDLHPQFIGYTRGKLHELVMKSYKSREFAAAINEVLDPWINVRQPKKEMEKHIYRKSEGDAHAAKRARLLGDEIEEYEVEEDMHTIKDESTFDDLCSDALFYREENENSGSEMGSWGLLDGHVLARVFHFLRSDIKSLAFISLTCKHWRAAASFYKDISRHIDLSTLGPNCSDSILLNITSGYGKGKLNSMVLKGCTNITSELLEEILHSFPCISYIDIRGCSQFDELALKFANINWIKTRISRVTKIFEESQSKIRSLKQITERTSLISKKGLCDYMDDFGELKDYFDSVDKRDSANQLFRRSLYKRSKLFDARKSSSILSRDARMRRWAIKKSDNSYKRMEEFLLSGLKDIMNKNTFDFFVPKVAEIEDRIKKGYYIGHGLSSVKEDISRMCRDAIKAKNRGDAGDMNHIIPLFIKLATRLEDSSKSSYERDEMMKSWEDDSPAASKYKKKPNKSLTDRKYVNKSNGTSFPNYGLDYVEYVSDREIRRRLSKLNKKSMHSESETSDDLDRSSDGKSESESTASDVESDLDIRSEVRPADSRGNGHFIRDEGLDSMTDDREWGARMTKASLVPPVTRKYEVIDQYVTVADDEDVQRKMRVSLPEDYVEKLHAQKSGTEESDMELPEVKDYKPRKQLGVEVLEQEVYGIDPYTHNLLLDSMPEELDWTLLEKHFFIEDVLLRALNKQVRHFTGTGNTPMMYPLQPVIEEIEKAAEEDCDIRTVRMCQGILKAIDSRADDKYVAYRKGLGVVCNKEEGFGEEDFVVEFLGEVYPVWKWFEKQDGIRSLQKNSEDPAPEFYNIYLERPKGDADGYDLVVVDAMHKANYASRICHSCRPNCEAKVTAVGGHYQIGIYSVRKIRYGEEITFDYNSVTESKEEYEVSVCLCGSQVCRGSYLNLTGEGAFQKVLEDRHGVLDGHQLMLEACELNSVSEEDYLDLGRAGLGSCLLGGLPEWVVAYSARLVRFINFERTELPAEILRHNLEEKRKYFSDICLEVEKSDAEVQAEGVYNQRLQNLAVTLDKVRYVMRCIFGDPKKAPPPLEKLSPEEVVSFFWKGEGSFVEELLQCMAPHVEEGTLNDLKSKIHAHDPSGSDDIQKELQRSLLWLRDEVRNLPCTHKSRHDAAADLIHIYAYTKCFFRIREYKAVTSPPVYISPLDLGPKYADILGDGFQEYCKTYGENYCLGQLIFWHNQTNADPDCSLAKASRGCLLLPEIGSFYAKVQKSSRHRVYGPRTLRFMLARMEKQPQRPWPKDRIWSFKSSSNVFGSPMLDAVLNNSSLDREMVHWLKHRPTIFQAMWDR
ncbi:hypothetical protein I3843_03G159300 [Carya illinoinensis]|uniref:SET domain-containing protein n=1 Tax=Carya illinoinensis TaxID=32201 RepID=A0A922FGL5_CARIL|nr:histone-lysine N-methyltransferase ATXR3-like isoform X1 [Carya illinoinensis]KAG2717108.1 hypothetical protein I3760_03G157900 [Carya illinoinensis]KAG6722389.1 hypothetical protein I3842_03G156900 [Carya illinoinensis]KAG7987935.1 hypothetical protein I3843_03G159300 [Carya illinoinensis]